SSAPSAKAHSSVRVFPWLLHGRAGVFHCQRELFDLGIPEGAEVPRAEEMHRKAHTLIERSSLTVFERAADFIFQAMDDRGRRAGGGCDARPAPHLEA